MNYNLLILPWKIKEGGLKLVKLPRINDSGLLRERVYQILKNSIIEGNLVEGSKITEAEISKQIGVSTTPVREAIRRLVIEGLITLHPNKRMTISKILPKDIIEVYQLRGVLCSLAARLLAEKITDEDIVRFNKIISEMEVFAQMEDVIAYSKLADKFHSLMVHLSGNKRLENITGNLHEQVYRYRIKSLRVKGRIGKSLNEHKKILEALSKHDPEQSAKNCQEHINNALENILQNTIDSN